jgi:hypothetical protein
MSVVRRLHRDGHVWEANEVNLAMTELSRTRAPQAGPNPIASAPRNCTILLFCLDGWHTGRWQNGRRFDSATMTKELEPTRWVEAPPKPDKLSQPSVRNYDANQDTWLRGRAQGGASRGVSNYGLDPPGHCRIPVAKLPQISRNDSLFFSARGTRPVQ